MLKKSLAFLIVMSNMTASNMSYADNRDQAKRIYQRLTGTAPSAADLNTMAGFIANSDFQAAANIALAKDDFYNVTLKNFATPWTNEEQTVFAALNDYSATVIGMVYNDIDFREVLSGDIIYTASSLNGVPAYSNSSNAHYEYLEDNNISLKDHLVQSTQSSVTGLPANATAGVMTTRAAAKSFFSAGTNRAMLRFTLMNHLCRDLEAVKDVTRPPDRIRQDVTRSPGGDSRIFLNTCIGCHSGMDPLAQAFAYYNYNYDADNDPSGNNGQISYVAGTVDPKYHINSTNFPNGYVTPDDSWSNYWRKGVNQSLGWSSSLSGSGNGAKSMGQELANSQAFAVCQVEKVFKAVCLRDPVNTADRTQINTMVDSFDNDYRLKSVFADAAIYCRGD